MMMAKLVIISLASTLLGLLQEFKHGSFFRTTSTIEISICGADIIQVKLS